MANPRYKLQILCCGVIFEEPIPAMDSPTSSVVPPRSLSGYSTSFPLVDPRANQLEEEVPSPTLTTILTKLCACCYHDPGIGDRGFFFIVSFLSFDEED